MLEKKDLKHYSNESLRERVEFYVNLYATRCFILKDKEGNVYLRDWYDKYLRCWTDKYYFKVCGDKVWRVRTTSCGFYWVGQWYKRTTISGRYTVNNKRVLLTEISKEEAIELIYDYMLNLKKVG